MNAKRNMHLKSRRHQQGISLVEIIGGLIIAGAIAYMAMGAFGTANSMQRGQQLMSEVQTVRATTQGVWRGRGSYGSGSLHQALKDRMPSTVAVADSGGSAIFTHSLNGQMNISGNGPTFNIELQGLNKLACQDMLTAFNDWRSVRVNNSPVSNYFDPMAAEAACNDNATVTLEST